MNYTIQTIRNQYARWVSMYFIIILAFRWWGGKYLTAFSGSPIKGPESDNFYWLMLSTGIPQYIIQHQWLCIFIDSAIIVLAISILIKFNKVILAILLGLFMLQMVTEEIYTCAHSKSFVCIYLAFIPLFFRDKIFSLLIDFSRYVLIFILVSAAYFKLKNGAITTPDHFARVLFNQHFELGVLQPNHWIYILNDYIARHTLLAQILFYMLFLTQLSFIVGIFTKKMDKVLAILLLAFAITTYTFMRIYNFDIVILAIPLVMSYKIEQLMFGEKSVR